MPVNTKYGWTLQRMVQPEKGLLDLLPSHLRVHREVAHSTERIQEGPHVAPDSPLDVPVDVMGLGVWVE